MQTFEFKVKIRAGSSTEAKEVLAALFSIKKKVTNDELVKFADAIDKRPSLINRAKMMI